MREKKVWLTQFFLKYRPKSFPKSAQFKSNMKFEYLKFILPQKSDFFGSSILKPIIPIRIGFADKSFQYQALIDSGADFSIFHKEFGQALGIDVANGEVLDFSG